MGETAGIAVCPLGTRLGTNRVLSLVSRYDAFLVDQWGVMHDGTNAYVSCVFPTTQDTQCRAKNAAKLTVV